MSHAIRWRRLDHPAREEAVVTALPGGEGWSLRGTVAGTLPDGRTYELAYAIRCDAAWATRDAAVDGRVGDAAVHVVVERDPATGAWTRHGAPVGGLAGCLDVDLGFSPVTNTLPIRRLALPVGAEAPVRAAWLRFPGFELEPLEQRYRRVAADRYAYESAGGRFRAELEVDPAGLVRRYGDYWVASPEADA